MTSTPALSLEYWVCSRCKGAFNLEARDGRGVGAAPEGWVCVGCMTYEMDTAWAREKFKEYRAKIADAAERAEAAELVRKWINLNQITERERDEARAECEKHEGIASQRAEHIKWCEREIGQLHLGLQASEMSAQTAEARVKALEAAIRKHRDRKVYNRYWESDDKELYESLGEPLPKDYEKLLGEAKAQIEFLSSCCTSNGEELTSLRNRVKELEVRVQEEIDGHNEHVSLWITRNNTDRETIARLNKELIEKNHAIQSFLEKIQKADQALRSLISSGENG